MRTSRLNPDTVAAPIGTYAHSVRVETTDGTFVYVSGQIASDADGNLVAPNDLPAQTVRVFENVKAILEANGASFADVVKLQTFITTMDGLAEMREVRSRYLTSELPASTAVQVAALVVPDAVIEVDVVAVIPS
ncbi:MAG TPA: RidA family protein [Actinomycetota bacterium]|nr:RidA family protein [Actinomycetota bacterium]